MRSPRLFPALLCAALAACSYQYRNPAEALRAGEVRGRVLYDPGAGVEPGAGISVSLKNSDLTQVSRETGLFVVLPLPAGRHTLLFRKGTTWAIERSVEVPLGSDGQPEGVSLGDVRLLYSAEVSGTLAGAGALGVQGGMVVDETTGLTATLSGFSNDTFSFPVLSTGRHRLSVAATTGSGDLVGGPVDLVVPEGAQQQAMKLPAIVMRPAAGQGRLTFKVQAVGASVDPTKVVVTISGVAGAVTPDANGVVDRLVPEGLHEIFLAAPPANVVSVPGHGDVASIAAPLVNPPAASVKVVVIEDEVADAGPIYLVAPDALSQTLLGCTIDADCACLETSCKTGDGTCGATGLCQNWTPPPAAPATTPFCVVPVDSNTCFPGGTTGTGCAAGQFCVPLPGPTRSFGFCLPCGSTCTFDGLSVSLPVAGECGVTTGPAAVTGTLIAEYLDEFGQPTAGPPRLAPGVVVGAVPVGTTRFLPGTYDAASAAFTIPDVPPGNYFFVTDERVGGGVYGAVESASPVKSAVTFVSGRQAAALPTATTTVNLTVSGLAAWQASDRLSVISAGAGTNGDFLAPAFTAGATGGSVALDWRVDLPGSGLPDAAAGDTLRVWQLGTVTVANTAPGTVVRDTVAVTQLTPPLIGDGSALVLPLGPPGATHPLAYTFQESPWLGLGADMPAFVTPLRSAVRVHALPHGVAFPCPTGVDATLWLAQTPTGAGDYAVDTTYGFPLDSSWLEVLWVRYVWQASFTASGASVPALAQLSAYGHWPTAAAPAAPTPVVGAPRALTINGTDTSKPIAGVGTTPLLAWSAPSLGTPTRYQVILEQVVNQGGTTALLPVGYWHVYSTTHLQLPESILTAGNEYVAFVSAIATTNDGLESLSPYVNDFPFHLATNVTAIFTP
ncbi:MAG: hypothetical protein QM704_12750 [Anaeromyxobacteraceae bacterium]